MRSPPIPIKGGKLPAIQTVEPWDGKDGQVYAYYVTMVTIYFYISYQLRMMI